jgi:hypothetical protein
MLLARTRSKFEQSLLYVGEITDLATQTIQQIFQKGAVEQQLVVAQFDQIGVRSL